MLSEDNVHALVNLMDTKGSFNNCKRETVQDVLIELDVKIVEKWILNNTRKQNYKLRNWCG